MPQPVIKIKHCIGKARMFTRMLKSIKRMEDNDTSGCLRAALDKAFEDELEYLKTPYPIFTR